MGARALPAALTAATLAVMACGGDGAAAGPEGAASSPADGPSAAASPTARPALCGRLRARPLGTVGGGVSELSGVVRGRTHRDLLYAHEDSGAPPLIIELRGDGTIAGRVAVTGARNVDWEDLAAMHGDLYLGDIGDNAATRTAFEIYRVAEPGPGDGAVAATTLRLRYPDGAHDAEALLADPLRGELVVVTKGLLEGRAYTVDATATNATLRRGPRIALGLVTAGDVSADGRTVALRSYDRLAIWRRRGRETLTRTLARKPCISRTSLLSEGQGEALALDGRAILTVPEGERPELRRYAPTGVSSGP